MAEVQLRFRSGILHMNQKSSALYSPISFYLKNNTELSKRISASLMPINPLLIYKPSNPQKTAITITLKSFKII